MPFFKGLGETCPKNIDTPICPAGIIIIEEIISKTIPTKNKNNPTNLSFGLEKVFIINIMEIRIIPTAIRNLTIKTSK